MLELEMTRCMQENRTFRLWQQQKQLMLTSNNDSSVISSTTNSTKSRIPHTKLWPKNVGHRKHCNNFHSYFRWCTRCKKGNYADFYYMMFDTPSYCCCGGRLYAPSHLITTLWIWTEGGCMTSQLKCNMK